MSRTLPALLLACAALCTAAHAQKREAQDACADAQTQTEMNACAGRKYLLADTELNRVYDQLVLRLGGNAEQRERLKAAETAWIRYRDNNCDYEASFYDGGSIRPLVHASCLERMTKARTAELREQVKELDH